MRHESITTSAPAARVAVGSGLPFAALPLVGRIGIAAIFLLSGFSKLSAPAYMIGYIRSAGLPLPEVALGVAIFVEIVGGLALIAGYRTRLVAAALALFSVVTAFGFHADLADQNQFIHFFKNIAMAGGLLQVVAFGAGAYSVDNRRR
ncbi:DoxX family protein [Sphingomonas crocodyli]|uniref:DoxX family protein n=1 Tax=Sphingomonas crocodyli TaxID=1979270 RepID=A0A437M545_9SPHN|nr:DoxX family protein [Sphingomonas crocodyli]RVT92772.1 DoxX family protein [Sphingomonas crocodyli]